MNKQAVAIGVAVAVTAAWNSWLFVGWKHANVLTNRTWQGPSNSGDEVMTAEPKLWLDIKKTSVGATSDGRLDLTFDESLVAVDGKRVELPGVGFLMSSGLRENEQGEEEVTEFLLLPGDGGVAWCCGLTPIPNQEFTVLVECRDAPFLASEVDPRSPAFFVNVEGILRLQKDNSINSLYTLEDVAIEFIDMKEVLPPNVMNMCLNQPMVPELEEQKQRWNGNQ